MIRFLFSDRYWFAKVALGLLLFAWMCHLSARDFADLYPPTAWVATAHERGLGKAIYPYPMRVDAVSPDGFEIVEPSAGRLRVRTSDPPPVGSIVAFEGRIVGPRTLEAVRWRTLEGWAWKRPANYVISIATLGVFLFLIRRRFRWRPESGVFRSRY